MNSRGKKIKLTKTTRLTLAIVSMFVILSAVFATVAATPTSAQTLPAGVAVYQAGAVRFIDATIYTGNTQPVITVSFSDSSCDDDLVGGTIYSPYAIGGTSKIALGRLNSNILVINSHFNSMAFQGQKDAGNAVACQRVITFTTNLNCAIKIRLSENNTGDGFEDPPIVEVAKATGAEITGTRSARFAIDGYSVARYHADIRFASMDPNTFENFVPSTNRYLQTESPLPSTMGDFTLRSFKLAEDGTTRTTDSTGETWDPRGSDSNIREIQITASDCDVPREDDYRVGNAEPNGSLNLALNIDLENPGCGSEGPTAGTNNFPAGMPENLGSFGPFGPSCTYGQRITLGSGNTPSTKTALKATCDIGGLLYIRDNRNGNVSLAFLTINKRTSFGRNRSKPNFFDGPNIVFQGGFPGGGDLSAVQLTLFMTADCLSDAKTKLTYTVDSEVPAAFIGESIDVTIARSPASGAACAVTPSSITIAAASARTRTTESPTAKTVTPIAGAVASLEVDIVVGTPGRKCDYVFRYPVNAGSGTLVLETEGGGFPPAATGVTRAPGASGPAEDGSLNGVITVSSTDLAASGFVVTAGYRERLQAVRVAYTVNDSTNPDYDGTDVLVMIAPTATSHSLCKVSPSAITLDGASARTTTTESPTAKTSTRIAGAAEFVETSILASELAGVSCSYRFTYPRTAAAFSLETEGNGFPPVASGVTRAPGTSGPAEDGTLDGVLEIASADLLASGFVVTAGYRQRVGTENLSPDAALFAAEAVRFVDGTSHSGNIQPIFTVGFSSGPCDDNLVGGTIHSPYTRGGASTIALGALNSDVVVINSHSNEANFDTTPANAVACSRTITFTSNLNCAFNVTLSATGSTFSTTPIASVAKDTSAIPARTRSASFLIHGADVAAIQTALTSGGIFFLPDTTSPYLRAINPVPARDSDPNLGLQASAVDQNGQPTGNPVAWGVNTNDFNIKSIQVTATDCDAPRAGAYQVANAEPARSVSLAISLNVRSGCEVPDATSLGLINFVAGEPKTSRRISLHPDCSYNQNIAQGPTNIINPVTNGLKLRCDVGGVLYFLTGENRDILQTAFLATNSVSVLQVVGNEVRLAPSSDVTGSTPFDASIVQLTLFVTTSCPSIGTAKLTYTVDESVNAVIARTPISVRIEPTAASPAECVVSPAVVTINGASATTQVRENPTVKSSTRITEATQFATVNIVTRNSQGRRCSYKFTYPRSAGALRIETEGNGLPPAVAGITRARGTLGPAEDNTLDGVLEISARNLTRNDFVVTVGYNQRELPIRIITSFDAGLVFTLDDLLRYRINAVGRCARFSEVLARALGSTGIFREVQAFGGLTIILDETLAEVDRDNSPAGALQTTLQPVIVDPNTNEAISCTLEVEELQSVPGCTTVGGLIQRVTFATGLEAFEFTFEHSCPGLASSASSRGLTN